MPAIPPPTARQLPRSMRWGMPGLALALLVAGLLYEDSAHRHLISQERDELAAVAEFKARLLSLWIDDRRQAARSGAATLPLDEIAALASDPGAAHERLDRRLGLIRASGWFDHVGLSLAEGGSLPGWSPAGRADLDDDVRLELHAVPQRSDGFAVELRISVPVRERDAPPLAWLELSVDASDHLAPLLAEWPEPNPHGELLLVHRDGRVVVLPGGAAGGSQRHPLLELAAGELGVERRVAAGGFAEGTDRSGRRAVVAAARVGETPWTLVASSQLDEVVGGLHRDLWLLAALVTVLFVVTTLLGWRAFRRGREELERALEDSERRFRLVFDRSAEGVVLLDSENRMIAANARAQALLGLDALAELNPPRFLDFGGDGDELAADLRDVAERGSLTARRSLQRASGERFIGELTLLRTPLGRTMGLLRDVSDRFAAELRDRQARRIARLGTWEWNPTTGAVYWDEQTYLLVGLDPARDAAGLGALRTVLVEEDGERLRLALRRLLSGETMLEVEVGLAAAGEAERRLHLVGEALRDASGQLVRVVGVIQDVTERRAAEVALSDARAQVAEAQKLEAIGRLAAGVSHDINNIAGVILGNAELAELSLEPGHPGREALTEIRQAAMRAGSLTRQLQGFSRRQSPRRQVVDLLPLIEDSRRLVESVLGARVKLEIEADEPLHPVKLDPTQLAQLLINLAANARDAMPRGGRLALRVRNAPLGAERARSLKLPPEAEGVQVEVEDSGSGMDAETLAHCFEPFFTTKGPGLGTGLGLSTARAIVDSCGGAIEAWSEPGSGTRITIWLPRTDHRQPPRDEPAPIAAQARGDGEVVLVVDDVDAMREVVCNMLSGLGYRTISVAGGEAALARIADEPRIALMLSDMVMPEMDGGELARRAALLRPALPVLFMTGYAELPDGGLPADVGSDRLLEKPFTTGELARRLRRALGR